MWLLPGLACLAHSTSLRLSSPTQNPPAGGKQLAFFSATFSLRYKVPEVGLGHKSLNFLFLCLFGDSQKSKCLRPRLTYLVSLGMVAAFKSHTQKKQFFCSLSTALRLCQRWDLNPQTLRHTILSRACLPISSLWLDL